MKVIKFCAIGSNWSLGQQLGLGRQERCWAVEIESPSPGALEITEKKPGVYGLIRKYYRRFDSYQDAEKFCKEENKKDEQK